MTTRPGISDLTELEKKNIKRYKKRVANGMASLLLIDGGLGLGKTTLAIRVLEEYQNSLIDYKSQLAFGGEEFIKKLLLCYKKGHEVIIYDEAGDFNKKGTLTQFNKSLNRVFDIYRAFKIFVIVVLPSARVLDKGLYDKGVVRGLLHIFKKSKTTSQYKAYSINALAYINYYFYKYRHAPYMAYNIVWPNYKGYFKNLPDDRSKELDKISTSQKLAFMEIEANQKNKTEIKENKFKEKINKKSEDLQNKILGGIK